MHRLLCHCMCVEEREVVVAIRAGARTVDEVGERCEAGSGCGSCRGGIAVLLAREEARRARGVLRTSAPQQLLDQLGLFPKK